MKRRNDRHSQAFQQLDDVSTSLAAENPILVLKANNVEPFSVQKISGSRIAIGRLLGDLEAHSPRVVITATGIVHSHHAGLQIRAGCRDRSMQIMGEGGDTAAARKMIADECNALEGLHCIVPRVRRKSSLRNATSVRCPISSGRFQSGRLATPQGFGSACTRARSIAMAFHLR